MAILPCVHGNCLREIYAKKNWGLAVGRFGQTTVRNKRTFFPYCIGNILNASAQRLMNTKSSREIASIMRERLECLLGRYAPCKGNKRPLRINVDI